MPPAPARTTLRLKRGFFSTTATGVATGAWAIGLATGGVVATTGVATRGVVAGRDFAVGCSAIGATSTRVGRAASGSSASGESIVAANSGGESAGGGCAGGACSNGDSKDRGSVAGQAVADIWASSSSIGEANWAAVIVA